MSVCGLVLSTSWFSRCGLILELEIFVDDINGLLLKTFTLIIIINIILAQTPEIEQGLGRFFKLWSS